MKISNREFSTVLILAVFVLSLGFLSMPFSAGAWDGYPVVAKNMKRHGETLTDVELGKITGGRVVTCEPANNDKACGNQKEGPRSQIILWDEWSGKIGKPQNMSVAPGNTNTGKSVHVDVQVIR